MSSSRGSEEAAGPGIALNRVAMTESQALGNLSKVCPVLDQNIDGKLIDPRYQSAAHSIPLMKSSDSLIYPASSEIRSTAAS